MVVALLVVHLLYAAGAGVAWIDFSSTRPSGDWSGILYLTIGTVLGFPWSMVPWYFGLIDSWSHWSLWLCLATNYLILWLVTFAALRWAFTSRAPDGSPRLDEVSIAAKLGSGVFLPLALLAFYQQLLWSFFPSDGSEPDRVLIAATLAIFPALAAANWWLLPLRFRTRRLAFFAGLALPASVALLEYPALLGLLAGMPPIFRPVLVSAFLLPLLVSLIYWLRRSSAPSSTGRTSPNSTLLTDTSTSPLRAQHGAAKRER